MKIVPIRQKDTVERESPERDRSQAAITKHDHDFDSTSNLEVNGPDVLDADHASEGPGAFEWIDVSATDARRRARIYIMRRHHQKKSNQNRKPAKRLKSGPRSPPTSPAQDMMRMPATLGGFRSDPFAKYPVEATMQVHALVDHCM